MPPESAATLLRPAAENVSAPPAENSSLGCAQCAAGSSRSESRNPVRSSRYGNAAASHADAHRAPSPKNGRVAAPTPVRKIAAMPAAFRRTDPPRNFLSVLLENVGNALQSGLSSPSGVGLLFRKGFCLLGKANLHPLAFYTINFTSPRQCIHSLSIRNSP